MNLSLKGLSKPLLIIIICFILMNLFYSFFPPTFYDTLQYHLAVPQFYIDNGGITEWNLNFNSNLPQTGEMLFLILLLSKIVILPGMLGLFASLAVLLLIYSILKDYECFKDREGILTGLLLFISLPQVGFLACSAKTDLIGMMFVAGALKLFFEYMKRSSRALLILSGAFWGFAVGTKYIFGIYFIVFALGILIFLKRDLKERITVLIVTGTILFAFMLPWMIKNYIITGNPLYPYLNSLFNSGLWQDSQLAQFSQGLKRGGNHSLIYYITFPFRLFIKPYINEITAVWGVFYLVLLPFIFCKPDIKDRVLIFTGIGSFILMMNFALVPRYFLCSLMILAIPACTGFKRFTDKFKSLKSILTILLIILVLPNFINQFKLLENFFQGGGYLKMKFNESESMKAPGYLTVVPYYKAAKYINTNLPDNSRTLFLGEDRTFYFRKKFIASSFNDQNPLINYLRESTDFKEFYMKLKDKGISHILYSSANFKRFCMMSEVNKLTSEEMSRMGEFFSKFKVIYRDKLYILMEI